MSSDAIRDTPMMRQYRDAKAAHPGMIVLFRMGDFYETFEEDAELTSRLLGLTLTRRREVVVVRKIPVTSAASFSVNDQIEHVKASGASQQTIDATVNQMEGFKRMYDNPVMNAAITFTEPFPIGLVVTLISAAVLRRK